KRIIWHRLPAPPQTGAGKHSPESAGRLSSGSGGTDATGTRAATSTRCAVPGGGCPCRSTTEQGAAHGRTRALPQSVLAAMASPARPTGSRTLQQLLYLDLAKGAGALCPCREYLQPNSGSRSRYLLPHECQPAHAPQSPGPHEPVAP